MTPSTGYRWMAAGSRGEELVEVFHSSRALIDGTDADEPNRAHAVSIAYVLSEAIEREGDGS